MQVNTLQQEAMNKMNFYMEASFHSEEINRVKRLLGGKCTYLSHERRPSYLEDGSKSQRYFLKAVLLNKTGGKDTVHYEIEGSPRSLTKSDYNNLADLLNGGDYEG